MTLHICYLAEGSSVHTQRWVRHFSELGHKVTLISFSEAQVSGVDTIVLHSPEWLGKLKYVGAVPAVRRLIRQLRPDIVHAHYATSYGFLGAAAGWHPLVCSAWGSDVLISPAESAAYRWLVGYALSRADLVTSMAEHMTARLPDLGAAPERVITLPFGVDPDVFSPGPEDGREPRLIVSTRNLTPVYNVSLLIEALPEVFRHIPEAHCLLIGDGPLRGELEARVASLGLEDRVEFLGRRTPLEVADFLRRAAVFVSTSLSDGNNISLNEAMACGACPVVTDIPANREWLADSRFGRLVAVDDRAGLAKAIVEVLKDEEYRRIAAQLNLEAVSARGLWPSNMERMEAYYQRLLEGK